MKSGAVNIIIEPGQGLTLDSAPLERSENGETLRSTIQLETQSTLNEFAADGGEAESPNVEMGTVFREDTVEFRTRQIDEDGDLVVEKEGTETRVEETDILYLEEEFVVTQRTDADNARNIVESLSSSRIHEAEVDLQSFVEAHPEAKPRLEWVSDDESDRQMCLIGEDRTWGELKRELENPNSAQLILDNLEWGDRRLHLTITQSGYVDIYKDKNGGHIGPREFAEFLLEEVVDHASATAR